MANRYVQLAAIATMSVAFVFMVAIITFISLPYEPLEYEYVETSEDEICENSDAKVVVAYTVNENLYDTIRTIEVESYWLAVDVDGLAPGTRRPGGQATLRAQEIQPGPNEGPGDLLRYTPNEPGVWRLNNDYIVRSNRPLLPAAQTFSVAAEKPTTILAREDPRCVG